MTFLPDLLILAISQSLTAENPATLSLDCNKEATRYAVDDIQLFQKSGTEN